MGEVGIPATKLQPKVHSLEAEAEAGGGAKAEADQDSL